MTRAASLHRTTIGKKILMAVTGFILFGFVFVHMVGNLKVFYGPGHDGHEAKLDVYAHFLRSFGEPALGYEQFLWIARIVLLTAVAIHFWAAITLTLANWSARPVRYRRWVPRTSDYASRTMIWGGVLIALFIVYHILHFTTGHAHPDFQRSVYANVVRGFQVWPVSAFYIAAQIALGLHLYHGVWSATRTLGGQNPRWETARRTFSVVFAVVVAAGNISIPVSVLAGVVK